MSKTDRILHCVLKKQWFDKIKSGEKTHEYRQAKPYWIKRIGIFYPEKYREVNKIRFTLGMTSEPEKVMLFKIRSIRVVDGRNTDLRINKPVYDIELGERLE